jgi:hypothetical protein
VLQVELISSLPIFLGLSLVCWATHQLKEDTLLSLDEDANSAPLLQNPSTPSSGLGVEVGHGPVHKDSEFSQFLPLELSINPCAA